MNYQLWTLALIPVVTWTCATCRASDTPEGRPAVSGVVERAPTQEEVQRQRELKAQQEWLKKVDEDQQKFKKQLDDLNKEIDELSRQFEESERWLRDLKFQMTVPLGPFRTPRRMPEGQDGLLKEHDGKDATETRAAPVGNVLRLASSGRNHRRIA